MTEFSKLRTPIAESTPAAQPYEPWEGYREQYREIMSESPESFQRPSLQAAFSDNHTEVPVNPEQNQVDRTLSNEIPNSEIPHKGLSSIGKEFNTLDKGRGSRVPTLSFMHKLEGTIHEREYGLPRAGCRNIVLILVRNMELSMLNDPADECEDADSGETDNFASGVLKRLLDKQEQEAEKKQVRVDRFFIQKMQKCSPRDIHMRYSTVPTTLGMGDHVEFAKEHLLNLGGRTHFYLRHWGVQRDPKSKTTTLNQALARMVLNFLAAPAASTDVEQLFSHSGLQALGQAFWEGQGDEYRVVGVEVDDEEDKESEVVEVEKDAQDNLSDSDSAGEV
ncbi:hypothetical protein BT96DRAFT_951086 [Gymnopus androsaceus JB14]|uniref:Uncharacterized protein n=1 Tax=Gymnopus androsaceus JB14 TaxID=1447944 RepID=A0A6A4GE69_9AGAR|nr:hypothetical protein BT96DRAFT_951086 [Gymnopus androsaceus JB14]